MRRAIGRPNSQDPDSDGTILLQYLNDFIHITMSEDVRLFEQFGTMTFEISEVSSNGVNDGVFTFNDVGIDQKFSTICSEGIISLLDPVNNSISWNELLIYFNPFDFYNVWGVNNYEQLTTGFPTEMLFYGNEMVFRTTPNDTYQVTLWGYKILPDYSTGDPAIPFDLWMRYIAYGAALNYARDFRFDAESLARIEKTFASERKIVLTHTHNQKKVGRCKPRF